jgi:hypothetical protein
LSFFWILAHDGFSIRHTPAEEGLIKEREQVLVNPVLPPYRWDPLLQKAWTIAGAMILT